MTGGEAAWSSCTPDEPVEHRGENLLLSFDENIVAFRRKYTLFFTAIRVINNDRGYEESCRRLVVWDEKGGIPWLSDQTLSFI